MSESFSAKSYHIHLNLFLQYLCSYIFCSNQMVNTRSTGSGSGQQQGQNNQSTGIPMPPPPPSPQPRDRRAEFLRGHPPTFSHTSDPLQADDWLRAVERQLDIAQC